MVNTPIPQSLKSEAKKAAKILRDFSMPSARAGPDKLIPAGILAKAKGLAILTVFRAGFLVTARGGSGIVIAKLDDDDSGKGWSAPTAIGIAGLGGGFEIGAEVTDFVILLNNRAAVEAFSKGGNLTLGGNFTIAAGPLGRNLEGDVSVRSPAAMYTYSKTKGIFAGISIEGSGLIERKDANKKFYGQDIRAHQILSGEVEPPEECSALYEVLAKHREVAMKAAMSMAKDQAYKHRHVAKETLSEGISHKFHSFRSEDKEKNERQTRTTTSTVKMGRNFGGKEMNDKVSRTTTSTVKIGRNFGGTREKTVMTKTTRVMQTASSSRSSSGMKPSAFAPHIPAFTIATMVTPGTKAIAEHSFQGQIPCDLSFKAGDEILLLRKTDSEFDWWEGTLHGKIGIFPANYVKIQ